MASSQDSLGLLLKQAIALHRDGQAQAAEAVYRRVLGVQKRHPDATYHLAVLLHQRGDTVEALRLLDRVLRTHPDVATAHNGRGMMLAETGQPAEALASFDRAVVLSPGHALAWINRGNCLAMLSRHADALGSYDRALAVRPDYAEAHYARGRLLQECGQSDRALAAYNRALALKPAFPEALNNRATLREQHGDIDDALADYARATALQPGFAEAWNNRGAALIHAGRHAEAMASIRRAVALRPDFIGARLNLADMLYIEGRQQDALALASDCAASDPADFRARILALIFQLPVLYSTELEIEERREAYRHALRDLQALVEATPTPGQFSPSVAASQPFFLAYQGRVDTEIQRAYGGMVSRITAAPPPALTAASRAPSRRVRLWLFPSAPGLAHSSAGLARPSRPGTVRVDRLSHQQPPRRLHGARSIPVRSLRAGADERGCLARADHRRCAPCPDVSRDWHGLDGRAARVAAARAGPVQCARPPGDQRHADGRLFFVERGHGAAGRRRALHRAAGQAARAERVLRAAGRAPDRGHPSQHGPAGRPASVLVWPVPL